MILFWNNIKLFKIYILFEFNFKYNTYIIYIDYINNLNKIFYFLLLKK